MNNIDPTNAWKEDETMGNYKPRRALDDLELKDSSIVIRCSMNERTAFKEACRRQGTQMNVTLRRFMREYVKDSKLQQ